MLVDEEDLKVTPELIEALGLVVITSDGSSDLVSLTHECVLAEVTDWACLIEEFELGPYEANLWKEIRGQEKQEDWPGWPAIFAFLKKHPDLWLASSRGPDGQKKG